MVMATTDTEEAVTLPWRMDDESWNHWTQGRGRQTASDVVRPVVRGDDPLVTAMRQALSKRVHVHLRPAQPEHLGTAHAGVEAEAEGVAGDRVAQRGLEAPVPARQHATVKVAGTAITAVLEVAQPA